MIDTEALRKKVIDLAIQGKLTEQLPSDGDAEELYAKIQEEKARLIKEGKIKKDKSIPEITEEEIPFEIPDNWKWVRLMELAYLTSGGQYVETEQGVLYVKVGDMNLEDNREEIVTSRSMVSSDNVGVIPRGSIIFPKRGGAIATNKKRLVRKMDIFVDSNTMGLTVILIDILQYIKLWFDSLDLAQLQTGTTIPQINNKDLYPLLIPLPPLKEQYRIVESVKSVFSEICIINDIQEKYSSDLVVLKSKIIDAGIQGKLTEQLAEDGDAETLYAQIQEEKAKLIKEGKVKKEKPLPDITADEIPFEIPKNWKWVRWGELSEKIQYGYNAPAKQSGRIKMVRISDIQDGKVRWGTVPFCDIPEEDIEDYLLHENDILFARTGGTVGKSYIVSEVAEEAIYAGYLIRTSYSSCIYAPYMKYFMESALYWKQLQSGTIATAQPNCNGKTLSKMIVPFPPYAEQRRIVEKIDSVLEQLE